MRGIWLLFFTVGFLGWSKKDPGAAEQKFWKWFTANEGVLFNFEEDQDRIFDQLQAQLHKVNQDLTFEFGPGQPT